MPALVIVTLAAALAAAPALPSSPRLVVALSRHGGVSAPRGLALAAEVQAALTGMPAPQPVADFSSCKSKRLCLLTAARKAGATVVVTVEVSSVLDDGSLRVEALSVDGDGARLGLVTASGPVDSLVATTTPELGKAFSTAIRGALGLVPPPAPAIEATLSVPLVEATPVASQPAMPSTVAVTAPPVADAPRVAQATERPHFSTSGIAGLAVGGAGAAALITSGIFGVQALFFAERSHAACPPGTPCADPRAIGDYTRAAHDQNAGVALAVGGAAALVTAAVLLWLAPGAAAGSSPSATIVPVPGGVSAQVRATF